MIKIEDITQEHLTVSLKWISKMSSPERWDLTDTEVAALLQVTVETYQDMLHQVEHGLQVALTVETIERLSLLLAIWKGLQLLVPDAKQELALTWFNTPNSSTFLRGRTLKNYLLENNTPEGFYRVRSYLNS